jgi:hypothetical protein
VSVSKLFQANALPSRAAVDVHLRASRTTPG